MKCRLCEKEFERPHNQPMKLYCSSRCMKLVSHIQVKSRPNNYPRGIKNALDQDAGGVKRW